VGPTPCKAHFLSADYCRSLLPLSCFSLLYHCPFGHLQSPRIMCLKNLSLGAPAWLSRLGIRLLILAQVVVSGWDRAHVRLRAQPGVCLRFSLSPFLPLPSLKKNGQGSLNLALFSYEANSRCVGHSFIPMPCPHETWRQGGPTKTC